MLQRTLSAQIAVSWRVSTTSEAGMLHDLVRSSSYNQSRKADKANLVQSSTAEARTSNQQNARPVAPRVSPGSSSSLRRTRPFHDSSPPYGPAQQADQHPKPQISPAESVQGAVGEPRQRGSPPDSLPRSHTSELRKDTAGPYRLAGNSTQGSSTPGSNVDERPMTPPQSDRSSNGSVDGDKNLNRGQRGQPKNFFATPDGLVKAPSKPEVARRLTNGTDNPLGMVLVLAGSLARRI